MSFSTGSKSTPSEGTEDKQAGKAMTHLESQFAIYPSLKGRRVLITGGATGIGEAFVMGFAGQGARVTFFDIQDEAARQLAEQIASNGHPRPNYVHCDITDLDAVRTSVLSSIDALGGLDVLINNAANDLRQKIEEVTPESWDRLMAVNLRHQFFVTQAALPALKQSGSASITRTLAHEVGKDNIRVNAILPGAIVTEKQRRLWLTPEYSAEVLANQALKRHLVPDEVMRLALFLAAEDSSAITGQGYIVDGGWA